MLTWSEHRHCTQGNMEEWETEISHGNDWKGDILCFWLTLHRKSFIWFSSCYPRYASKESQQPVVSPVRVHSVSLESHLSGVNSFVGFITPSLNFVSCLPRWLFQHKTAHNEVTTRQVYIEYLNPSHFNRCAEMIYWNEQLSWPNPHFEQVNSGSSAQRMNILRKSVKRMNHVSLPFNSTARATAVCACSSKEGGRKGANAIAVQ